MRYLRIQMSELYIKVCVEREENVWFFSMKGLFKMKKLK